MKINHKDLFGVACLIIIFILIVALTQENSDKDQPTLSETNTFDTDENGMRPRENPNPTNNNNDDDDIQRLIDAIIQVESGGNPNAVGDNGKAVGILQIWPITVADANRILGREVFTLADRYDPHKSIDIFLTITGHYSSDQSFEVIARRWNGGPRGELKSQTAPYWEKVYRELGQD